jgi:hypothetical protein
MNALSDQELDRCNIERTPRLGTPVPTREPLPSYMRDKIDGLGGWAYPIGIVMFPVSATIWANVLSDGWGFMGIPTAIVVTPIVDAMVKQSRLSKATAQWQADRAVGLAHSAEREHEAREDRVRSIYRSALRTAESANKSLENASGWLRNADYEYRANAFAPFWDAVEQAALNLGQYHQEIRNLGYSASTYNDELKGIRHTFPPFPVAPTDLRDARPTLAELHRVTRLGQTNFQFANIWEHRATRSVMVAGFHSLTAAISGLPSVIESSVASLQQSISSDFTKVVDGQDKSLELVDKHLRETERVRRVLEK